MAIKIDKNGFPCVYADSEPLELASIFVPTKTGQGNPFHSSFTGKFTFAPPGTQILKGGNLIKGLSTSTRKILFDRAAITKANQISAQVINGMLHIVLLNDGRRLDSFAVKPRSQDTQKAAGEATGATLPDSLTLRDAVVDAAREGLQGSDLRAFLKERGIQVDQPGLLEQVIEKVEQQRLTDVVDYLHQQLRKQVKEESQIDRVRLSVGRGYLRQVFSRYDEGQIRDILVRLQGRGWSEDIIHSNVISKLPKRLKEPIQSSIRVVKGKEEVKKKKAEKSREAI